MAVVTGEADGNFQAVAGVTFDHDFSAVGADDALGDHEAETAAALLRGEVGFEDAGHGFLGHTATGVGESDVDPFAVGAGADLEETALLHGFARVFDDVVKRLLELVLVDFKDGESGGEVEFEEDVAGLEFRSEKFGSVADEGVEVVRGALERGGTDGAEELGDDGVEAFDFFLRDFERLKEGVLLLCGEFAQAAFEELEVDGEGVEGVADFVGHTGGEELEGGDAFAFQRFLRGAVALGEVAHDEGVTGMLAVSGFVVVLGQKRNDIKIEDAVGGVENFDVAGHDFAALGEFFPAQSADVFGQRTAEGGGGVESKEESGGIVHVNDRAGGVGDDDAFADGVEDGLEETFVAGQFDEEGFDVFRLDAAEAGEEFVEEGAFHCRGYGPLGPEGLMADRGRS